MIENSTRSANTAMMTIVGTLRYGERRGPGGPVVDRRGVALRVRP
jgi:hypothetical protein